MFIPEITTRFRNFNIQVDIDSRLLQIIDDSDKITTPRRISFNLYKLIYAIGTIQSRRFAPSSRMKFFDKSDLIEKINALSNDFQVKLSEIRQSEGPEVLKSISEDFGVGLSVVIAESLFKIKFSTIQRIYGNDKRPDWKCQTRDDRTLVVESKGATSQTTSAKQENVALVQKTKRTANVRIASLSVLNETQISTNRFLDPPTPNISLNNELQYKILRAGHYSSVFSFLGIPFLSRYYSQMRNRLLKSITPEQQIEKNNMYFELRDSYPYLKFKRIFYTGKFYKVEENKLLFVGIDRQLLSYEGFLSFIDYQNEIDEIINGNHYIQFKDGILIIEYNDLSYLPVRLDLNQIKNYQENISIRDVDEMTEISFIKYIAYVLVQLGFEIKKDFRISDSKIDIYGIKDTRRFAFEVKLFKKKKASRELIDQFIKYYPNFKIERLVLITNAEIADTKVINNMLIIDRKELIPILKNKSYFIEKIVQGL